MITPEGFALLLKLAAGSADDPISGWKLAVTDGTTQAETPAVVSEVTQTDSGAEVTLTGTFGEDEANVEWAIQRVVSGQGVVVDEEAQDQGRKAPGSEWTTAVTLALGQPAGE